MQFIPVAGLNAIAWTMTSVAIVLTLGRFWRRFAAKSFGWDDYLNGIALVFLLLFTITYQLYVPVEYQAQLYDLGLSDKPPPASRDPVLNAKLDVVNIVSFFCVIYMVKASLLALYWRIFEVHTKFRVGWSLLTGFTVLSFLISVLALFWNCGAPKDFLQPEACAATPRSVSVHILVMWCVLNVLGDVFLIVLPMSMLKPMRLPLSQKFGLAAVFCLALLTIAFNILRTVYTLKLQAGFQDENTVWALMEPTVAVIVCALPVYRHCLSWISPKGFGSFFSSLSTRFSGSRRRLAASEGSGSRGSEDTMEKGSAVSRQQAL